MFRVQGAAPAKMRTQSMRRLCAGCGQQIKGKIRRQRCEKCYRSHLREYGRSRAAAPDYYNSVDGVIARANRTPGGCWLHTGNLDRDGYGLMSASAEKRAHRAVYEARIGPIPKGMDLDHLCHDPEACLGGSTCPHRRCINPAHLSPTTRRANWLRGSSFTARNLAKTHCAHGHEFTPENTAIRTRRDGRTWRRCRACHRAEVSRKPRKPR